MGSLPVIFWRKPLIKLTREPNGRDKIEINLWIVPIVLAVGVILMVIFR